MPTIWGTEDSYRPAREIALSNGVFVYHGDRSNALRPGDRVRLIAGFSGSPIPGYHPSQNVYEDVKWVCVTRVGYSAEWMGCTMDDLEPLELDEYEHNVV